MTVAVGVVVALVYTVISLRRGPVLSADSARYSQWADLLIASHFNYVSWSSSLNWPVPPMAYAGWVTIVALNKLALGSAYAYGIVVVNLVLAIVTVGMVLRLVERLTSSRLMVGAAGLAFLVAFELWLWIPYALSDLSFMFLSFWVVYLLCSDERLAGRRSIWRSALPLALALLALVYRPAGLPLVLLAVVTALFGRRLRSVTTEARIAIARWSAITLVALIAIAVVLNAALVANPGSWPFPFLSGWIQEVSREYRQGIVIFGRPETFHSSPGGLLDYVWLSIDRLRSFFVFSAQAFSRGHTLVNVAFFVPVYAGWLVALVSLMRSRSSFNWAKWWATAVGTLFVVFFGVFHSLQYIDYDWRYRLPCLPVLIMLGSIGWNEVITGLRTVRRRGLPPKLLNDWQGTWLMHAWAVAKWRRAWWAGGGAVLLAVALMATITSVVYAHDSKIATRLSATTLAVVTNVNGPNYGFRYDGDQCAGGGSRNPPPAAGTQLRIFLDPNNRCDNVDYDPVARQRSDLMWLLMFSGVFSLVVGSASWDAARHR
jgi:hypothetical protein